MREWSLRKCGKLGMERVPQLKDLLVLARRINKRSKLWGEWFECRFFIQSKKENKDHDQKEHNKREDEHQTAHRTLLFPTAINARKLLFEVF